MMSQRSVALATFGGGAAGFCPLWSSLSQSSSAQISSQRLRVQLAQQHGHHGGQVVGVQRHIHRQPAGQRQANAERRWRQPSATSTRRVSGSTGPRRRRSPSGKTLGEALGAVGPDGLAGLQGLVARQVVPQQRDDQ